MNFLSVDRIENDVLVCENEKCEEVIIEKKNHVDGLSEGSIIEVDSKGNIVLNKEKYEQRKKEILKLQKKLNIEK